MRKDEPKKCINCGETLPYRYKGRQKIYCSDMCRKSYRREQLNYSVDIYIDGGTRHSNICLVDGDHVVVKYRKGKPTNNELEYLALLYALGYVRDKYKGEKVTIYSDSQLMVNQMNGKWRVTTDNLIDLHDKCSSMMTHKIKIKWISRKINLAGHVLEKQNLFQDMYYVEYQQYYIV